MTAEVKLPDDEGGRSCKTCDRWDGSCTHPRHSNDDPDRPCLLYRYRRQEAVGLGDGYVGGWKVCAKCGRPRQKHDFTDRRGREWKACNACRDEKRRARLHRPMPRPGHKFCRTCGREQPLGAFVSRVNGSETASCAACRQSRSNKRNY